MIHLTSSLDKREDDGLTPLMDIIFILLLFFVVAATFTVHGLNMDLPRAQVSKAVTGRVVKIRMTTDGAYFVDEVPVAKKDMPYVLHTTVANLRTQGGRFVLFSDPDAPVEGLVFLVDHLRRNGAEKLLIATNAPSGDTP